MGAVIVIVCMAVLFLLLAIFLWHGKGGWLISGYNMMSEEEKSKYDEKKLCRSTGAICAIVSVLLLVMAYLGYRVEAGLMPEGKMLPFAIIFIVVVLSAVGVGIWYSNTKCKK